jgi:hypothetical protein
MQSDNRLVPAGLLQDLANFLANELPMAKARSAVEALEFFLKPEHNPDNQPKEQAE